MERPAATAFRLTFATLGAVAITIAMLLGMNRVAEMFQERDPTRYFSITEFIPQEGRSKPRLARPPEAQPERPSIDYEPSVPRAPLERPTVEAPAGAAPQSVRPPVIDEAPPAE